MAKKPTRLRFTEDDLADFQVKKASDRADKAADKAEKAVDKLASKKKATKLRQETDAAGSRKAKLRFGKADNSVAVERPSTAKQLATRGTAAALTSKAHRAVSEYEDDNVGDRTDYSQNAAKTNDGEFISSYECDPKTADEEFLLSKRQYQHITGRQQKNNIIAYQIRQSFKPGEVTPEEANQVGYETAIS